MTEITTTDIPQGNERRLENEGPIDMVDVGQYWWVQETDYKDKILPEELMCVAKVGSNHVKFEVPSGGRHGWASSCRIHFDVFEKQCRYEPDAIQILKARAVKIQGQIQECMDNMLQGGKELCLIKDPDAPEVDTTLPVPATVDPKIYKGKLERFKDDLPAKHKEIDELGEELAATYLMMAYSQKMKLGKIKKALAVVDDRIFTVELYCGVLEEVKLIKDGEPSSPDEKLAIRQQMLYMDEETLFDYDDGGMDFKSIEKFDEWLIQPENLARTLPESKGVVAFRVRRYEKSYSNKLDYWTRIAWKEANKQTYLLLRNGEKVYRIATDIDFSPRLVPFRSEFEDAFKKEKTR